MIIKKKKVLFAFHREKFVRFTEGITSEGAVEEMARMVAHELVHQWIGNLVTPEWWDEIWIKEGLAAYLAYKDRHQLTRPDSDYEIFKASKTNPFYPTTALLSLVYSIHLLILNPKPTVDNIPIAIEAQRLSVKSGFMIANCKLFMVSDYSFVLYQLLMSSHTGCGLILWIGSEYCTLCKYKLQCQCKWFKHNCQTIQFYGQIYPQNARGVPS